ncbi:FG-GAP-like repeat-containing protein, partial [bacterium]
MGIERTFKYATLVSIVVSLCLNVAAARAESFQETFSAGWHLITLPCNPNSLDPGVVFASPFEDVYVLEGGTYIHKTEMTSVNPGLAYWAYFSEETTVTIEGTALTGENNNSAVSPGWNMIGSPFQSSSWEDATIDGTEVGESSLIESLLYYYDAGTYGEATYLTPWRGYFVKVGGSAATTIVVPNSGEVIPQGSITGVARLQGRSDYPIIDVTITGPGVTANLTTDPTDGTFSRQGLDTGAYTVTASYENFESAATTTQVFANTETDVGILLLEDKTDPEIKSLYPSNGLEIEINAPTISALFSDTASGIDTTTALIKVDSVDVTSSASVLETGFTYDPATPFADGDVSLEVSVSDKAGNTTTATSTFTVNTSSQGLGQPTGVTATECEYGPHTLLCVAWEEVDDPEVTGYSVYVDHSTETFAMPYSGPRAVPVNRYTVGGLTPGETYTVQITSVKEVNSQIVQEGALSSKAWDATAANSGNAAIVSFRAVAESEGGASRAAYRTSGTLEEGLEAVATASVTLSDSGGAEIDTGTTDEFGWVELEGTESGTYNIDAVHDMDTPDDEEDDIKVRKENVVIIAGQAIDIGDLKLEATGWIQGFAYLADKTEHYDITVGIPGFLSSSTTATGSFNLPYIPPGTWDVRAYKAEYTPVMVEGIVVESGKVTTIEEALLLTPGIGISGMDPIKGENNTGTDVEIYGWFFNASATAYIQKGMVSRELENIDVLSSSTMAAVIPSGFDYGTYDIKVENPDGSDDIMTDVFTVTLPAPELTSATPTWMVNTVEQLITIYGSNLFDGASVYIGATLAADVNVNFDGTEMTCRVPTGISANKYDITVINPDSGALYDTLEDYFTVKALTWIEITPPLLSIKLGDTMQFEATCRYIDGATTTPEICTNSVIWNSSNTDVGTITTTGLFTASSSDAGSLNIMAYKGVISSDNIPVSVFDPAYLFQYSGQILGDEPFMYGTESVFGADVDNDSDIDVIEGNTGGQMHRIHKNNGSGIFIVTVTGSESVNTKSIFAADFNNDGYVDFVEGNSSGNNKVFLNDKSGGFPAGTDFPVSTDAESVFGADVDNDGNIDLIEGIDGDPNIVWRNDGNGNFTNIWATPDNYETRSVFAMDVDNDGYIDFIEGNGDYTVTRNKVWRNDGAGSFPVVWSGSSYDLTRSVFAVDVDNDGYIDFIEGNKGANKVWRNDGGGNFTDTGQTMGTNSTESVFGVDVDNDGDIDYVEGTGGYTASKVWLNDGEGTFAVSGQSLELGYTTSVFCSDVNSDGRIDIIFGNIDDDLQDRNTVWYGLNAIQANSTPFTPSTFNANVNYEMDNVYNDVEISWDEGSDYETVSGLLSYNVKIGETLGGNEMLSGVTSIGYGNMGALLSKTYNDLPYGEYYWGIQTVDTGYNKSDWSFIESFTVGPKYSDSGQSLGSDSTYSVFGADMNNDGYVDILEVNYEFQPSKVRWNDGYGNFPTSWEGPITSTNYSVF